MSKYMNVYILVVSIILHNLYFLFLFIQDGGNCNQNHFQKNEVNFKFMFHEFKGFLLLHFNILSWKSWIVRGCLRPSMPQHTTP